MMASTVERREHSRKHTTDRSLSPVTRRSPRHRSSPRREKSPVRRRSSPKARSSQKERSRSPAKENKGRSSHKERSAKEKLPDRARSPKKSRPRSPVRASSPQSPSPRSKRLMRAQASKEGEKVTERERGRGSAREESVKANKSRSPSPRTKRLMRAQAERVGGKKSEQAHERESRRGSREERNKGRHGERGDSRDRPNDRRTERDHHREHRSRSPSERNHRGERSSRSPSRGSRPEARDEVTRPKTGDHASDEELDSVAKMKAAEESLEAKEKQKPSFELSGKLAEETNKFRGITLLFNEPADARKPNVKWRLYVFKGGEVLNESLYVHRQSCYLFGRERRVADIPTDHPSCSKQHAVIQYRLVEKEQPDGLLEKQVRPYIMDLGSTNGTFINDNRIEPQRYYELIEKDTIKFGNSSREYVILHENSTA